MSTINRDPTTALGPRRRILSLRDQGRALRARRASQARPPRDLRPVARADLARGAQTATPNLAEKITTGIGVESCSQLTSGPALHAADPSTVAAPAQGRLRRRYAMAHAPPLTSHDDRRTRQLRGQALSASAVEVALH